MPVVDLLDSQSVALHDAIKQRFITRLNKNSAKLKEVRQKLEKTGKQIIGLELATNVSGLGIGGVATVGVLLTIVTGGTIIPVGILSATAFGVGVVGAGVGVGGLLTDKRHGSKEIQDIFDDLSMALKEYNREITEMENDLITRTRLIINHENKTKFTAFLRVAGTLAPMSKAGALAVKKTGEAAGIVALRLAGDLAEAGAQVAARNVFAVASSVVGALSDGALVVWNIYRFIKSPSAKAKTLQTKIESFDYLRELIENDIERRKIINFLITLPFEQKFHDIFELGQQDFDYIFS